ncbi:MAG: aquaporin family protein [Chloroflexi bacterium]|jgi:glycerol uptake facilitator protein|nr:aquaporin family protein [Chloroflexota bacterium]
MQLDILMAEIFGTMILILLGDGVVAGVLLAKSKANASGWIVITTAWAFAVFAGVVVAGPFSGAHLNPAVTLGIYTNDILAGKEIDAALFGTYIVGEMIGAMLGAFLVFIHYYPHWAETEDPGLKLAVFSTGPAIRNTAFNFISEVIGTFVLVFVIFCFGNNVGPTEGGLASLGALPVAFLVLVIGLALGGTTGYAINPARDLGPRIMHQILPIPGKGGSDWAYSWIPVVGPLVGGVVAAVVYQLIFVTTIVEAAS